MARESTPAPRPGVPDRQPGAMGSQIDAGQDRAAESERWLRGEPSTAGSPVGPRPHDAGRTTPGSPLLSRRALGLGALGLVGLGVADQVRRQGAGDLLGSLPGPDLPLDDGPHATCADPSALSSTGRVGSAALVYEVDQVAQPMAFEPGFHAQLVRWLADWNTTSRYRGVREIWSYGAYVPKDDCRSWHAAGRAFDISRLRAGNTLLVSCREDLWDELTSARRAELARRYWTLAASLHLHFAYVLTFHFDELHRNHIHVDNGISEGEMSRFDKRSAVQNQAVQAICQTIWGRAGEVTGDWSDTRSQAGPVLDELGLSDLGKQQTWQSFLRASVARG